MLALGQAAVIVVDLGLGGGTCGAGLVVVGVAHAWGGEFGEQDFPYGGGFGGEVGRQTGHRIAALCGDVDAAFAGAFGVVGFGSVLIEQEQSQFGGVFEFFGADPDRDADQVGFELLAGGGVEESGESVDRVAQHFDVVGVDQAGFNRGGDRGQYRGQGFTGQGTPRPQLGGLTQTAAGFCGG